MSFQSEQKLESSYLMHTFARQPVEFVRGAGMQVEDFDGNQYLDFLAGIGVASLGHCHPAVVSALQVQAQRLIHVGNYYYIEQRGEVASLVSSLLNEGATEPVWPWQSFFANSGAEANECALKLARLYARKKAELSGAETSSDANAQPAQLIVTLGRSFHGRTFATLAATTQPAKQADFAPLPGGFIHIPPNDLDALENLFNKRGPEICAVMLECVQGESGVHPCTPAFISAVRRLTCEYGALFICDEVQSGVFRCGTPFSFQHYGVLPDMVTIAKGVASGMPAGICAARASVAAAFEPGDHGSTFGGSCLAVAAAYATLRTLIEGSFAEKVEQVGTYLRKKLGTVVGLVEVRGLGLMVGVDIADNLDAPALVARCLQNKLLINATGPHTLRFLPPLICTQKEVDIFIEILERSLKEVGASELGKG